ncbi:MAG TPA: PilZ domain-containing protein [Bacillota bacterium]|nr:PilZ domain-containing protein [Bacillota bacterium]
MLTGIINRRIADRAPFQGGVKIKFITPDGSELVSAAATNISAGGMRFTVNHSNLLLNIGDQISFVFQLPDSGEISVMSEIRYRDIQPGSADFIVHYGVKFLDISLENWNAILAYCNLNKEVESKTSQNSVEPTSQDLAVNIQTQIQLEDGTTIIGEIEDISFGGARISVDQLIPVNSLVTLNFYYKKSTIPLKGFCIWSAPDRSDSLLYLAGIFFNHLEQSEFDQLKLLINQQ